MSEQPDKPVSKDAADRFREFYNINTLADAREKVAQLKQLWDQPNPWRNPYYADPETFYRAGPEVVNRFLSGRYKPLESPQKPEHFSAGRNKLGARQDGIFWAVSYTPDVCKTPIGAATPPIPYVIVSDLSKSSGASKNVRFNNKPVYILNQSVVPNCTGDEAGVAEGVISGTVGGETKPTRGSSTVKVNGQPVIRDGDPCTMNSGNCTGFYVTVPPPGASVNTNGSVNGNTNPATDKGVAYQVTGFLKGAGGAVWKMAQDLGEGLWNTTEEAVKLTLPSLLVEELSRATGWGEYRGFTQTMIDKVKWGMDLPETVKGVVENRKAVARAVVDSITRDYIDRWEQGNYGEMAGAAVVDVGSLFLGGIGEVGKAAQVARVTTEAVDTAAVATQAAEDIKIAEAVASPAAKAIQADASVADRAGDGTRIARRARVEESKALRAQQATSKGAETLLDGRKRLPPEKVPCFHPYNKSKFKKMTAGRQKAYLEEMAAQLQRQQDAINSLTVEQYQKARALFAKNKRNPGAKEAQEEFREDFESKLRKALVSG